MSDLPPRVRPPGDIPPRIPPDGAAIASLICGVLSLLFFCSPVLSAGAGIPGLVCGLLSRTRVGARTAGIVCSVAGMVLSLVWLVFTVAFAIIAAQSEP